MPKLNSQPNSQLSSLRQDLDLLNKEILSLLTKRYETLDQVLDLKKAQSLNLHDPSREEQMLLEIKKELGSHPASPYIEKTFKALLEQGLLYMKTTQP